MAKPQPLVAFPSSGSGHDGEVFVGAENLFSRYLAPEEAEALGEQLLRSARVAKRTKALVHVLRVLDDMSAYDLHVVREHIKSRVEAPGG